MPQTKKKAQAKPAARRFRALVELWITRPGQSELNVPQFAEINHPLTDEQAAEDIAAGIIEEIK